MTISLLKKLYNFIVAPAGAYINKNRIENMIQDLYEENTSIVNKINEIIEKLNNGEIEGAPVDLSDLTNRVTSLENNTGQLVNTLETLRINISNKANSSDLKNKQDKFTVHEILHDNTKKQFDDKQYYKLLALSDLFGNNIKKYYIDKIDYTINHTSYTIEELEEKFDCLLTENFVLGPEDTITIPVPSSLRDSLVADVGYDCSIPILLYMNVDEYQLPILTFVNGPDEDSLEDDTGSILGQDDDIDFSEITDYVSKSYRTFGGVIPIYYHDGDIFLTVKNYIRQELHVNERINCFVKLYKLKFNYE